MEYTSSYEIQSTTSTGVTFTIHKPSHGRRVEFDRLNADFRDRMRKIRKRSELINKEIQRQRDLFNTKLEKELAERKQAVVVLEPESSEAQAHYPEIDRLSNGLEMERLRSILVNLPSNTDKSVSQTLLEQIIALSRNAVSFEVPAELSDEQDQLNMQTAIEIHAAYKPARVRWGLKSISGLTIDGAPASVEALLSDGPGDLVNEIYDAIEKASNFTPEQLKNSSWPITSSAVADGLKTNTTATNVTNEETGKAETAANSPS
jgi:hypothetical protein